MRRESRGELVVERGSSKVGQVVLGEARGGEFGRAEAHSLRGFGQQRRRRSGIGKCRRKRDQLGELAVREERGGQGLDCGRVFGL